jgi:chromate transport protein ChrA
VALWWLPIIAVAAWLGWESTPARQGVFFSQAALVTFGGAYAVLPYVAQQAVERFGWLSHNQMVAGLGLAETTPGPLIMVLQFVGFVGGWNQPGPLSPPVAATLGAIITTWATFLPSFLMVFLGAPHIENLRNQPRISAALGAITAAVVGVILNLGVVLTQHALFPPGGFDVFVAITAIAAFLALHFLKIGTLQIVAACAVLGLLWRSFGPLKLPLHAGSANATRQSMLQIAPEFIVTSYVVFVYSVVCHEAAHAWSAMKFGDRTAYEGGQVSLDPTPHIRRSPFGMVLVPIISLLTQGTTIGWASAPLNPDWVLQNPRKAAWVALAGPAANFLLCILATIIMFLGVKGGVFAPAFRSGATLPIFSFIAGTGPWEIIALVVKYSILTQSSAWSIQPASSAAARRV